MPQLRHLSGISASRDGRSSARSRTVLGMPAVPAERDGKKESLSPPRGILVYKSKTSLYCKVVEF